ncbi:MAG: hypothetical protein ABIL07_07670 [candidate division WOR-3 bacterium]
MKMMNGKLLVIILLLSTSCKSNFPGRFYKSSDEVTGGFYCFSLDLKSDRTFKLNVEVTKQVKQSESGVEWESSNSIIITGKWFFHRKMIKCIFDKQESYIDSIFLTTDFNIISAKKRPIISFSSKFDTAYIFGIPCLANENKPVSILSR